MPTWASRLPAKKGRDALESLDYSDEGITPAKVEPRKLKTLMATLPVHKTRQLSAISDTDQSTGSNGAAEAPLRTTSKDTIYISDEEQINLPLVVVKNE